VKRLFRLSCLALGASLLAGNTAPLAPASPATTRAVWAWGSNRSGQLGVPTSNFHVPKMLEGMADVTALAGGGLHTLALRADGSVWAWGDGKFGQLGLASTDSSLIPRRVQGLEGITQIAAGDRHSLALRESDHKLWVWGSNAFGQLGLDASVELVDHPVELEVGFQAHAARAGGWHTLLLDGAGQLWAFGLNVYGQLGDGSTSDSRTPVKVGVPAPVSSFAAGQYHNLAVGPGGNVWGFGINSFGELGNGVQGGWDEAFSTPVMASGLPPIAEVAAAQLHSIARSASGELWGWGYNTSGQVGDGSVLPANTGRLSPAKLAVQGIARIAAGGVQNIALAEDGAVWVWGANRYGACGTGSRVDERVPRRLERVEGAVAIATGGAHSLVVARARPQLSLMASGSNEQGQLGDGSREARHAPVPVALQRPVIAAASGAKHSLAVSSDHRLWVWGQNASGQLGLAGGDRDQPQELSLPLTTDQGVAAVAAGGSHSIVLASDGTVWAFGDNSRGQLGDGSSTSRSQPARVVGLSHVSAIAAGPAFSLALRDDGTVWAWGSNACGELAQPELSSMNPLPVQVLDVGGLTAIAAGACHGVALSSRGTLQVWGQNDRGQLGLGAPSSRVVRPTETPVLDDVVAIAAGAFHTLALRSDGAVWGFGDASAGQLGDGAGQPAGLPRELGGVGPVDLIAAGFFHGAAASAAGDTFVWGLGVNGQLGLGDASDYWAPQPLPELVRLISAGTAHTLFGVEVE
jgi:alpha-tubulin suppressor-like RCC1 family protein